MNKINDAREKVERAKALLAEAEAELREAEQPAEVYAYIGTKLDNGNIVVAWDDYASKDCKCNVHFRPNSDSWDPNPTINDQAVTHFQPFKAEILHRPDDESMSWLAYMNGESIGFWPSRNSAVATLRNLAERLAPWWDGELKITERA